LSSADREQLLPLLLSRLSDPELDFEDADELRHLLPLLSDDPDLQRAFNWMRMNGRKPYIGVSGVFTLLGLPLDRKSTETAAGKALNYFLAHKDSKKIKNQILQFLLGVYLGEHSRDAFEIIKNLHGEDRDTAITVFSETLNLDRPVFSFVELLCAAEGMEFFGLVPEENMGKFLYAFFKLGRKLKDEERIHALGLALNASGIARLVVHFPQEQLRDTSLFKEILKCLRDKNLVVKSADDLLSILRREKSGQPVWDEASEEAARRLAGLPLSVALSDEQRYGVIAILLRQLGKPSYAQGAEDPAPVRAALLRFLRDMPVLRAVLQRTEPARYGMEFEVQGLQSLGLSMQADAQIIARRVAQLHRSTEADRRESLALFMMNQFLSNRGDPYVQDRAIAAIHLLDEEDVVVQRLRERLSSGFSSDLEKRSAAAGLQILDWQPRAATAENVLYRAALILWQRGGRAFSDAFKSIKPNRYVGEERMEAEEELAKLILSAGIQEFQEGICFARIMQAAWKALLKSDDDFFQDTAVLASLINSSLEEVADLALITLQKKYLPGDAPLPLTVITRGRYRIDHEDRIVLISRLLFGDGMQKQAELEQRLLLKLRSFNRTGLAEKIDTGLKTNRAKTEIALPEGTLDPSAGAPNLGLLFARLFGEKELKILAAVAVLFLVLEAFSLTVFQPTGPPLSLASYLASPLFVGLAFAFLHFCLRVAIKYKTRKPNQPEKNISWSVIGLAFLGDFFVASAYFWAPHVLPVTIPVWKIGDVSLLAIFIHVAMDLLWLRWRPIGAALSRSEGVTVGSALDEPETMDQSILRKIASSKMETAVDSRWRQERGALGFVVNARDLLDVLNQEEKEHLKRQIIKIDEGILHRSRAYDRYWENVFDAAAPVPTALVLIGGDGRVQGFLDYTIHRESWSSWLDGIAVKDQKKGCGSYLMDFYFSYLRREGISKANWQSYAVSDLFYYTYLRQRGVDVDSRNVRSSPGLYVDYTVDVRAVWEGLVRLRLLKDRKAAAGKSTAWWREPLQALGISAVLINLLVFAASGFWIVSGGGGIQNVDFILIASAWFLGVAVSAAVGSWLFLWCHRSGVFVIREQGPPVRVAADGKMLRKIFWLGLLFHLPFYVSVAIAPFLSPSIAIPFLLMAAAWALLAHRQYNRMLLDPDSGIGRWLRAREFPMATAPSSMSAAEVHERFEKLLRKYGLNEVEENIVETLFRGGFVEPYTMRVNRPRMEEKFFADREKIIKAQNEMNALAMAAMESGLTDEALQIVTWGNILFAADKGNLPMERLLITLELLAKTKQYKPLMFIMWDLISRRLLLHRSPDGMRESSQLAGAPRTAFDAFGNESYLITAENDLETFVLELDTSELEFFISHGERMGFFKRIQARLQAGAETEVGDAKKTAEDARNNFPWWVADIKANDALVQKLRKRTPYTTDGEREREVRRYFRARHHYRDSLVRKYPNRLHQLASVLVEGRGSVFQNSQFRYPEALGGYLYEKFSTIPDISGFRTFSRNYMAERLIVDYLTQRGLYPERKPLDIDNDQDAVLLATQQSIPSDVLREPVWPYVAEEIMEHVGVVPGGIDAYIRGDTYKPLRQWLDMSESIFLENYRKFLGGMGRSLFQEKAERLRELVLIEIRARPKAEKNPASSQLQEFLNGVPIGFHAVFSQDRFDGFLSMAPGGAAVVAKAIGDFYRAELSNLTLSSGDDVFRKCCERLLATVLNLHEEEKRRRASDSDHPERYVGAYHGENFPTNVVEGLLGDVDSRQLSGLDSHFMATPHPRPHGDSLPADRKGDSHPPVLLRERERSALLIDRSS